MKRSKLFKNMSVGELIKTKEGYVTKIKEIDAILEQAVKAMGIYNQVKTSVKNTNLNNDYLLPNFNNEHTTPNLNDNTNSQNVDTQSSHFSLFDTEAYVRKQELDEAENSEDNITEEIDSLRNKIASQLETNSYKTGSE